MAIILVAIISVNYSEESFLKELFIMDILKYGSEKIYRQVRDNSV